MTMSKKSATKNGASSAWSAWTDAETRMMATMMAAFAPALPLAFSLIRYYQPSKDARINGPPLRRPVP